MSADHPTTALILASRSVKGESLEQDRFRKSISEREAVSNGANLVSYLAGTSVLRASWRHELFCSMLVRDGLVSENHVIWSLRS